MPVVFTLSISRVVAAGTCVVLYITPAYDICLLCDRTGAMQISVLLAHARMQADTASTDIMHRLPHAHLLFG